MNASLQKPEPMNDLFLQWTKNHVQDFASRGISLEISAWLEKELIPKQDVQFMERKDALRAPTKNLDELDKLCYTASYR